MTGDNTMIKKQSKIFKLSDIIDKIEFYQNEGLTELPEYIELRKNGGNCQYSVYNLKQGSWYHIGYIQSKEKLF